MRPKTKNPFNLKLLLIPITLVFFLFFILRSNLSPSSNITTSPRSNIRQSKSLPKTKAPTKCPKNYCGKIPQSISKALIHYSTSTITPQQTLEEISITSRILEEYSPCNFLVFGLGHDSLMWHSLNHGGRTVFLEEDESWIEQIKRRFPMLESYRASYGTKVSQANDLMHVGKGIECTAVSDPRYSVCQLALKGLPSEVYEVEWDLIMVDAPTGYYEEAPGRMAAIYTAGMMARNRRRRQGGGGGGGGGESGTHVFVHDVNREVEDKFSMEFLCEGYLKKQEGRLRHFVVPSHRDDSERPFCP